MKTQADGWEISRQMTTVWQMEKERSCMEKEFELEALLRGKKFKKLVDGLYRNLRERYGLKQVEVDVLFYLGAEPEKTSAKIAKELSLYKGHVSMAMEGLCGKNYLVAEQDQKDRRYIHYRITEKGARVQKEIYQLKDRIFEKILRGFTEEELKTLAAFSRKLMDNIEQVQEL